jgi:uncharacterized protein with ATP-grasp and redox domains
MKVRPECLECVIRQARNTLALQRARGDSSQQILEEVKQQLVDIDWEQTPADLSNVAYRTIEKYLQVDPFAEAKQMQNQMALGFYPDMRQLVEQSKDRLLTAVRIAATGNVIDLGIGMKVDIAREVERILQTAFPVDDTQKLRQRLSHRRRILYVGDNAGEIVFDRILVEELLRAHDVTFVVRGGAVINDATLKDAEASGMTRLVPVITTDRRSLGIRVRGIPGALSPGGPGHRERTGELRNDFRTTRPGDLLHPARQVRHHCSGPGGRWARPGHEMPAGRRRIVGAGDQGG